MGFKPNILPINTGYAFLQKNTPGVEWTPAQLPNLVAWYDASDASTLTTAASGSDIVIIQWLDKSGRNNHMTASLSARPYYRTVGLGTGPCVIFNGITHYLNNAAFSWGGNISEYDIMICGEGQSFAAGDRLLQYDSSNLAFRIVQQSTNKIQLISYIDTTSTSTSLHSSASLWGFKWDGTNQYIYNNTTLEATTENTGTILSDGKIMSMAASTTATFFGNFKISGMWATKGGISIRDRQNLYNYCVKKGWIQNWTFSAAESAAMLPNTIVWVSSEGVTTADAGATVQEWVSTYGGAMSATLVAPSGTRPTYTAGTYPLIDFNGTTQYLTASGNAINIGVPHSGNYLGFVGQRTAFVALGNPYVAYSTRYSLADRTTSTMYATLGNGSIINTAIDPDANDQHYWMMRSTTLGSGSVGHDGITDVTVAAAVASFNDGENFSVGSNVAGTLKTNFQTRAIYVSNDLNSTQLAYLRALLTFKTGVNC